jgi:hypothetical protein
MIKGGLDKMKNIETGKFLSIVFNTEHDATNKQTRYDTYLKIDVTAIRNGLLHHVRGSELTVLLGIASFMNTGGECYPTQRQIAEITGLSLTTVNKAVSNLLEIQINGMPILDRVLRGTGQRKNSVYTIFDLSPKDIDIEDHRDINTVDIDAIDEDRFEVREDALVTGCDSPVDEITDKVVETTENGSEEVIEPSKKVIKNSKDLAHYFAEQYKEAYGKSYVINYKRDLGLIKNKLIKNFSIDEIVEIIHLTIKEYPSRWGNSKYPYPTIGMLCSWLCNEVVRVLLEQQKADKKSKQLIDQTADYIDADYSDFMEL